MASIIDASTAGVGGIITTADNSGNLNIQSGGSTKIAVTSTGAAVTGTLSATGAVSGTTGTFSGNVTAPNLQGPAFSAVNSTSRSVANASYVKVICATEEFDTASAYDNATNYRFTPQVAGYYQVNGQIAFNLASGINAVAIFKNGAEFKLGNQIINSSSYTSTAVSALIYLNGSTDYVELYTYQSSGGTATYNDAYFQASMVRSA
jgi:hypothetical protein